MVSTRQMSTSGNATDPDSVTPPRLSVVTRATHQPAGGCSPSSSSLSTTGLMTPIAATSSSSTNSSSTSSSSSMPTVVTRHSQITLALKSGAVSTMADNGGDNGARNSVTTFKSNDGMETDFSTEAISQMQLLDLPQEIMDKILSYVGFKKVSQCRMVSKKMNEVCMNSLNSTFSKLIKKTYNRFHAIKANMPRRESARRSHPLACECDIIETCNMRLSLLQMTFGKHIERGHCCFFPGSILDEVYAIFNYISITPRLQRPYKVTDELFDLSTMAMEYFREHIEPTLPGIAYFNKDYFKIPTTTKRPSMSISSSDLSDNSSNSPPQNHMVLRKGIRKIKQGMKMYNNQLSVLRTELRNCKRKSVEQGKQITEQQKLLAEQQKQTLEYANRLDENDKKNEEMSRKFSTLLQELNKCKTELQFWRSKSPAIPICLNCNQKASSVLPSEDIQALVNQGVNPDDIIIRLNDMTDTESDDVSLMSDNQMSLDEDVDVDRQDFTFPDEVTTAKLLAANVAVKNLKRKYQQSSNNCVAGCGIGNVNEQQNVVNTNTINTSIGNVQDDGDSADAAINNINILANHSNIASTSKAAAGETAMKQQEQSSGDRLLSSISGAGGGGGGGGGYSTKCFYGNQEQQPQKTAALLTTQQRGGVIVSPVSKTAEKYTVSTTIPVIAMAGKGGLALADIDVVKVAAEAIANGVGGGSAGSAIGDGDNNEDVLQETKKARRVQKATRCVNSNGKRSK